MTKYIVNSIEHKTPMGKKEYWLIDLGGTKASSFVAPICKEGDEVEATIKSKEVSGKTYYNVYDLEILQEALSHPVPNNPPVVVNEAKKGHEENIAMHHEEMAKLTELNKSIVLLNTTMGSLHEELKDLTTMFHRLFLSPEIEKATQQIVEKKEAAKK